MLDVNQIPAEGPPLDPSNATFCDISAHGTAKHVFRVGSKEILWVPLTVFSTFLSPPVLMHGWLLYNAFCLSICLSVDINFIQGTVFMRIIITLTCDVEVKGHIGQGQRSRGPRSNKGCKQRQVGSQQCQVASFEWVWYIIFSVQ